MYKCKIFNTYAALVSFLNASDITKSDIVSITTGSVGVALVYIE